MRWLGPLIVILLLPLLLTVGHFEADSQVVTKVFIYPQADLTIVEGPDDGDKNYGDMEFLDVGYLWMEEKHCGDGGPCMVLLVRHDIMTLLKYKLPDPGELEVKRVLLVLPGAWIYSYLPSQGEPSELCAFVVGKFDHIFFEDLTTWNRWNEQDEKSTWDPESYVTPLAGFPISPNTKSPLVLDLTQELKGRIQAGGENPDLYLALAPMVEWSKYEWSAGETCQLLFSSSESGSGGPFLYVEYGPQDYQPEEGIPPIPLLPQAQKIPPDIGSIVSGLEEEVSEPIPLPEVPWDLLTEIPKMKPPAILPTEIPTITPPKITPVPPAYPPTFSLQISPQLLAVKAGEEAVFTVHIVPHFGFSEWVHLTASGAPAGSSVQITPGSINPLTGSKPEALLRVQVPSWTPPGNYLITVTGKASQLQDTATAWLVVKSASQPQIPEPGAGDFGLSISPSELEIDQAHVATFEVSIQAFGEFEGTVDLALANPPQGSMFIVHGSPISPGGKAYVRIRPTEETPPGSYHLTIIGTSGELQRSATAKLVVRGMEEGAHSSTSPISASRLSIDLRVGDHQLTADPGERTRTWLSVKVMGGRAPSVGLEVVSVDRGLNYNLESTRVAPESLIPIYLWAEEPGEYEIKIRAVADNSRDEETIRLVVPVTGVSATTGRASMTERRTGTPAGRTTVSSPDMEGAGIPSLKIWPDLAVLILLALVIILSLMLLRERRRPIEGSDRSTNSSPEEDNPND